MHEDVTSQERSKERLYEEEIELKWEKGGSGLVFYTDAQYWQEEEGGMQHKLTLTIHLGRKISNHKAAGAQSTARFRSCLVDNYIHPTAPSDEQKLKTSSTLGLQD